MSTWAWLLVDAEDAPPPADASVTTLARTRDGGTRRLSIHPRGRKPAASAVRMDAALVDADGPPAVVGLLLLPPEAAPLFDDPAVTELLRAMLRGAARDGFTTFVRDSTRFAGGLVVSRAGDVRRHPLARFGVVEVLDVDAGVFGRRPLPAGPVVQRYAGEPWPVAGFAVGRNALTGSA